MRKLIDANVILRYLLRDHQQMSEESKKIIEGGAFTLPEVLAEVVYVLKSVYEVERAEITNTLIDFPGEINIENQEMICKVLTVKTYVTIREILCYHLIWAFELQTYLSCPVVSFLMLLHLFPKFFLTGKHFPPI